MKTPEQVQEETDAYYNELFGRLTTEEYIKYGRNFIPSN